MRREEGYTTIELIIALSVLVVVLLVSALLVRSARAQMRDAVRISDIKQIQAGLELFYNEQYSYPVVANGVVLGVGSAACLDSAGFNARCSADRVYMPIVPSSAGAAYISRNNEEQDCSTSPCAKYALQFNLERARGTLAEGPNCARPEGIKPGACQ